jgi:hypothetical protein
MGAERAQEGFISGLWNILDKNMIALWLQDSYYVM